jgi:inner membrane protein
VDALSHALVTATLFLALGSPSSVLPFAVIGAVILDADIFFMILSDKSPALYLFTHGGVAHSIPGSGVMAALAAAGIWLASLLGVIPASVMTIPVLSGFWVLFAGSLVHLCIDALAYPGIPVFYPWSERKITVGVLPGPSILLFITTGSALLAMALGRVSTSLALAIATTLVILFLAFRTVMVLAVRRKQPRGRLVPLPDPLQWIIINEDQNTLSVARYSVLGGIYSTETFEKYINTDLYETEQFHSLPEIRRLNFHSYSTVIEKTRSGFIFSDPLREKGYFLYPPGYRRWEIRRIPETPA